MFFKQYIEVDLGDPDMGDAKSLILKYYRTNNIDYAYMLNGRWGEGKTYFVKNELIKASSENLKALYVSLFDKTDWSEVMASILYSLSDSLAFTRKIVDSFIKDVFADKLSETVSSLNNLISPFVEEKIISKIKGYLIILDDLERTSIPISHLMGKVSEVLLNNNIHVLLVGDISHMNSEDQKLFLKWKEKIIRKAIELDHSNQQKAISSIIEANGEQTTRFQYYKGNKEIFDALVDHVRVTNLRSWEFAFDIFDELFDNQYIEEYYFYNELLQTIILTVQFCIENGLNKSDLQSFTSFIKERNMIIDENNGKLSYKIRYVLLHQAPYIKSLIGYIQGNISDIKLVYNEMINYFPVVDGLQLINAKLLRVRTCKKQDEIEECVKQAEGIINSKEIQSVVNLYSFYNTLCFLIQNGYGRLYPSLESMKEKTKDLLYNEQYFGDFVFLPSSEFEYCPDLQFLFDRVEKAKALGDIESFKKISNYSNSSNFKKDTGYDAKKFMIDIVREKDTVKEIVSNLKHYHGWVFFDFVEKDVLKTNLSRDKVVLLSEILDDVIKEKMMSQFDLIPIYNTFDIVRAWLDKK